MPNERRQAVADTWPCYSPARGQCMFAAAATGSNGKNVARSAALTEVCGLRALLVATRMCWMISGENSLYCSLFSSPSLSTVSRGANV